MRSHQGLVVVLAGVVAIGMLGPSGCGSSSGDGGGDSADGAADQTSPADASSATDGSVDATLPESGSGDDDGSVASNGLDGGVGDAANANDGAGSDAPPADGAPPDGGATEEGTEDGASTDASGPGDGSASDAGTLDAGTADSGEGGPPNVDSLCAATQTWAACDSSSPCTCAGFSCVADPVLNSSYNLGHADTYCESACNSNADCAYFYGTTCIHGFCGAAQCDISSVQCSFHGSSPGTCIPWMSDWDSHGSFCPGTRLAYGVCYEAGSTGVGLACSPWSADCQPGLACVEVLAGQGRTCSDVCQNTLSTPTCPNGGGACAAPDAVVDMPNCVLTCP